MFEGGPLPNQHENKGESFGPWGHRILSALVLIIIFYSQNNIMNILNEIGITNNPLRIIIQFVTIVILLGFGHRLLRRN